MFQCFIWCFKVYPRSHRFSSHPRPNAFVIQTKLINQCGEWFLLPAVWLPCFFPLHSQTHPPSAALFFDACCVVTLLLSPSLPDPPTFCSFVFLRLLCGYPASFPFTPRPTHLLQLWFLTPAVQLSYIFSLHSQTHPPSAALFFDACCVVTLLLSPSLPDPPTFCSFGF